jgi:hypothetical protein
MKLRMAINEDMRERVSLVRFCGASSPLLLVSLSAIIECSMYFSIIRYCVFGGSNMGSLSKALEYPISVSDLHTDIGA